MSIALTTITGGPQTGLTSPTYTVASDTAPDANGKQYAVTAIGGTQAGVTAHSVSSPFTLTFWRPKIARLLGKFNANGYLISNPVNTYKVITRKGVTPLTGQAVELMTITTSVSIPAGSETNDSNNMRAAMSAHFGAVWQQSAGIGDLGKDGVL